MLIWSDLIWQQNVFKTIQLLVLQSMLLASVPVSAPSLPPRPPESEQTSYTFCYSHYLYYLFIISISIIPFQNSPVHALNPSAQELLTLLACMRIERLAQKQTGKNHLRLSQPLHQQFGQFDFAAHKHLAIICFWVFDLFMICCLLSLQHTIFMLTIAEDATHWLEWSCWFLNCLLFLITFL